MSFLHQEYLYLLAPLLIIFLFLFTKKEVQGQFFSEEVMQKLRVSANNFTLKRRNILFFVISFLIILALAGPIIKEGTVQVKSKSADIMIALDISDSMLAEDVYPNRLKLAKEKVMELLRIAPHERIGVVAFAKNSYLVSPMSFDHSAVSFLLRQLSTDSITEQGTDFLALLNVVDKTIKKPSKKHLLILSDGGDKDDFEEEIAYAKEKNIVVYILGIGTKNGAPIKKQDGSFITYKNKVIVSKLNENIADFSTSSGGVYIKSVKSNDDIKAMLSEIEGKSNQREIKVEEVQKFIPLFYYPLALSLFLLLIAMSSMGKRKTVPSVLALFGLLFITPDSKASLLDFLDLKEAKEAYMAEDYNKSSEIYSKYANDTNSDASFYNNGNSLYKQNNYVKAIESYKKAKFDDNVSRANAQANIGNAQVKLAQKPDDLQKAVNSYEKSLASHEDKDVRENLEAVKKELEKHKQDKKDDKQNKDDKQDKEKKNEDKKDSEDGEESDEDGDEKDKSKDEKSDKQDEQNKNDEEKKNQEKNDKKSKLDKLDKDEKDKDKKDEDSASGTSDLQSEDKMSDAEKEKWLNRLNMEQNTFMYKLNDNKTNEENSDEKPW